MGRAMVDIWGRSMVGFCFFWCLGYGVGGSCSGHVAARRPSVVSCSCRAKSVVVLLAMRCSGDHDPAGRDDRCGMAGPGLDCLLALGREQNRNRLGQDRRGLVDSGARVHVRDRLEHILFVYPYQPHWGHGAAMARANTSSPGTGLEHQAAPRCGVSLGVFIPGFSRRWPSATRTKTPRRVARSGQWTR